METSVDLLKETIKDTGGWSPKKGMGAPLWKDMYEEVDDSGRGERDM